MSPGSSEWEGSDSRVADSVVLPMSEVILANPQAKSTSAKTLLRRGFLGPRAAHPLSVLDDALLAPASALICRGFLGSGHVPPTVPAVMGSVSPSDGAAELGRSLSQPTSSTSTVSKSQVGYSQRVKEKVAKQLNAGRGYGC